MIKERNNIKIKLEDIINQNEVFKQNAMKLKNEIEYKENELNRELSELYDLKNKYTLKESSLSNKKIKYDNLREQFENMGQ